jgi:hypothetical protein
MPHDIIGRSCFKLAEAVGLMIENGGAVLMYCEEVEEENVGMKNMGSGIAIGEMLFQHPHP